MKSKDTEILLYTDENKAREIRALHIRLCGFLNEMYDELCNCGVVPTPEVVKAFYNIRQEERTIPKDESNVNTYNKVVFVYTLANKAREEELNRLIHSQNKSRSDYRQAREAVEILKEKAFSYSERKRPSYAKYVFLSADSVNFDLLDFDESKNKFVVKNQKVRYFVEKQCNVYADEHGTKVIELAQKATESLSALAKVMYNAEENLLGLFEFSENGEVTIKKELDYNYA